MSLLAERLTLSETVSDTDNLAVPVYEEAPSLDEAAMLSVHRSMREDTSSDELGWTSRTEEAEFVAEPEEIAGAAIDVEKAEALENSWSSLETLIPDDIKPV